ncbi:MAG: ABC transporter permease [Acidobacteria bacterium]|nr:ABC transporter permease [Acidobacteriota bacterium]
MPLQDLLLAVRTLKRSPIFALTVIATLALAIGANTAIFSLVNHYLLQPLPYPDADKLVQFWFTTPGGAGLTLSVPDISALSSETGVFQDVAAYDFSGPGVSVTGGGEPEQVKAIHVSESYFRLLGAPFHSGRPFMSDEDKPNGPRAAILSYDLWQRRFTAASNVLGKSISLGHESYTIVGIAGAGFRSNPPAQIWLPLQADPASTSHAHYLRAIGRLRPGVTIEQANARLRLTFAAFLRRFPLINPQAGFLAKPLRETQAGDVRTALVILLFTVGFLLLIACSNIANLLLARATSRTHEIAVRVALGATRKRILSQLLTECGSLAMIGGILGLAFGQMCLRLLLTLNPEAIPGAGEFATLSLDWRVLLFTGLTSLFATMMCGLFPACKAAEIDLAGAMQSGGARTGASRSAARASSLLVVVEVALAVILIAGAALMLRSFAALRQVQSGLDTSRVLTLQMSLQGTRFRDTAAVANLVDSSVEKMQTIPGVIAAASSWTLPVELAFGSSFIIEGRPLGVDRVHGPALMRPVSSNYTAVFGVPLLRGRFFTARDTARSASVAVISDAMARKYWPGRNPIGERITIDKYLGPDFFAPPREIVGIAGDVHDTGLNKEPSPLVYIPQSQVPNGMTRIDIGVLPIVWAVKTAAEPYSFSPAIQRELRAASGGLAAWRVRSMEDVVKESTARSDFTTILLAAFAMIALLLAVVGVYGLISYTVQQRTRELAIRIALGATPGQVRRINLWQGLRLTGLGVVLGAAGSIALARFMETLVYGVQPLDPMAIGSSCAIAVLAALLAAYLPARRVARLDPLVLLR